MNLPARLLPEWRPRAAALLAAACCAAAPAGALAASGSLSGFGASATTVKVGDTVDFWVSYEVLTTAWSYGGSNPFEPDPIDGWQEWYVNWYNWEFETARSVWLQAGGQGFNEYLSLSPGATASGTWSFSVTFDRVGTHSIDVSGGWEADIDSGSSNETAERYCYMADPDYSTQLTCDWWTWRYDDWSDQYSTGDSWAAGPISIEVTAVPEPATWALGLAGAALLGWRLRRRT